MSSKSMPDDLGATAVSMYKEGKYYEASELFSTYLCKNSSDVIAHFNRGMAFFKMNNFQGALEDAEICLSLESCFVKGVKRKALGLEGMGRIKQAIKAARYGEKNCSSMSEEIESHLRPIIDRLNTQLGGCVEEVNLLESNSVDEDEEDDLQCSLCEGWDPPLPRGPSHSNRPDTLWINCDICSSWYHQYCCGFQESEAGLVGYFKCLPCSLISMDIKDAGSILAAVKEGLCHQASYKKVIESKIKHSNNYLEINNSKATCSLSPHLSEKSSTDRVCKNKGPKKFPKPKVKSNLVDQLSINLSDRTEESLVQPLREEASHLVEEASQVEEPVSVLASLASCVSGDVNIIEEASQVEEPVSVVPSSLVSCDSGDDNIIEDIRHLYADHPYFSLSYDQSTPPSISVPIENERDKIIVVDNIDKKLFKSSRDILKEIRAVAPDIKVSQAYLLAKGGLAIHLHSQEDRCRLFDLLPPFPFGGFKKMLSSERLVHVYIKNVPFSLGSDTIAKSLSLCQVPVSHLSRVISSWSGRPSKSLKLITSPKGADWLCKKGVIINSSEFVVERKRMNLVVRCFNCQKFGHIAQICQAPPKCPNCAEMHPLFSRSCSNKAKCVNCDQPHASSSLVCPSFKLHYDRFSSHSCYRSD